MNTSAASKGPSESRLGFKLRDLTDRVRALEHRRASTAVPTFITLASPNGSHWRITVSNTGVISSAPE